MLKIKFQLSVIAKLLLGVLEKVPQVVVDKQGAFQNAHDLKYRSVQLEVVLNECDEIVRDNGNVDLYPHNILGITPEPLDTQMQLDPFEEQLHLPTIAVKQHDILGLKIEVVGVVKQGASKVGDIKYNTPEFGRIVVAIPFACKSNSFVGKHTISSIKKPLPEQHLIGWMSFLPCDKKCVGLVNNKKSRKVEVASDENIAGKWFIDNSVHELGVMSIRKSPSLCFVEMSLDYSSELPLWQKTRDLCENVRPHKRLCTDFGSVAKMQISNPGQWVSYLTYCA